MSQTTTQTFTINTDLKIVKTECYDADIMNALCRDTRFSKRDLGNLSRYKKNRKHANEVEVVYHYGKGCEADQLGRLFPHGGLGLQAFPHDMRNPLLEKHYWDCDMENAHYNIMIKLTNEWGFRNDAIKRYCANPAGERAKVSSIKRIAKNAFLKVAYGGNIKLHNELYNDDGIEPDGDTSLLKAIEKEIAPLVNHVWLTYTQYHKLVKKKDNPRFSLFALILQTEECKCLRTMDAYLKTQDRRMDIYIHDGGEVRKLPNELKLPEYLLRGMEQAVAEKTGHKVKIVVKPFEHHYNIEVSNKIDIWTDEEACKEIYKRFGSRLIRGIDNWYVHLKDTNYWSIGNNYVNQLIMDSNIHMMTENGSKPYSATITGINNIFKYLDKCVKLFPINENFIIENNKATQGRIYYEDQYWDLNEGAFFPIESDVVPIVYIKRPAPDLSDITPEDIKEFTEYALSMFSDETDVDLYLRAISRAMGGYFGDKVFYVFKGERNSGKGVLQDVNHKSFGEYVSTIDPPMNKSFNSGDASQLRWVLTSKLHLNRLAFSNEAQGIAGKEKLTLSGDMLKKVIASGGDKVKVRGHYKDEIDVINNATTFMSFNKIPECDVPDGLETMRLFNMPFKFVDQETVKEDPTSYRLRINDIKNVISENDRFRDIYTYMVFKAYKPNRIEISDMSILNQEEQVELIKSTTVSPVTLFKKYFIANEDGYVFSELVHELLDPAGMTDKKFSMFMTDRGFISARKQFPVLVNGVIVKDDKGRTKVFTKTVWKGLSLKDLTEDEGKEEFVDECDLE